MFCSFFDSVFILKLALSLQVCVHRGVVNRGLKQFFSMYRPSCLIKAYLGLKSTDLRGLDPWLTIYSILTSYFLATA
jgi:hypothetical protein